MPLDHFDIIAPLFDRAGDFSISDQILQLLSLSSTKLLLDAGGGTGRVASALRKRVREVIVADTSRGMLRRAAGKNLAAICAPVEMLPFPSESFDRIIMVDALHHVLDQHKTAYELWRLLTKGGRIVIVEPDIRKSSVKLVALGEKLLFMRSHILDGDEVKSLFAPMKAEVTIHNDKFNIICVVEKVRGL
jgi:ubiquinone/menaquinone biosynthesis C-methylase UbiE